jgi:hypothetical protein
VAIIDSAPEHGGTDGMTPDEFNAAVAAVTNAFGDPTRREIYLFVRETSPSDSGAGAEQPGVTASDVAAHFGLHPNRSRRRRSISASLTQTPWQALQARAPATGSRS